MQRPNSAARFFEASPVKVRPPSLTPRSREACRRNGVEPIELVPLPLEAFFEKGRTEAVARVKHEAFEALRQKTLHAVNEERARIVALEQNGGAAADESGIFKFAPRSSLKPAAAAKSTAELEQEREAERLLSSLLQRDRLQVLNMQLRQQEEIEHTILFEIKQQRVLDERDARNRADAERAAARKAEIEARRTAFVEATAKFARDKAAREETENKQLRGQLTGKLKADLKRLDIERRREAEYREFNRRKEAAIRAKAQIRKERFEVAMAAHELSVAEKKRKDDAAEELRLRRLDEQKARVAAHNEARRAKQEERVAAAERAHAERQRALAEDHAAREAESEARRLRWEAGRNAYFSAVAERNDAKRDKALETLRELEQSNDKYVNSFLARQASAEENRNGYQSDRRAQLDKRAAEADMRLFERHLAVERTLRREEYARMCLGEKLEQTAERIGSMLDYKERSLHERKQLADKSAQAKEDLATRIEQMRLRKVRARRGRSRARERGRGRARAGSSMRVRSSAGF
jgi:hypothetical protein